jgi:NAD(P)-dependent dehydrogenase (short-subunit alcohol dehydrogenase family)
LLSAGTDQARADFDSKFWGQYYAAKYGAPKMRPSGSIIFFAGIWSQRPAGGYSAIAAINSAIEGLGRALAGELAPIRVNIVSPGLLDTPIYAGLPEAQRTTMFAAFAAAVPVKRVGRPEDIAQTVFYLMSNSFTSGSTFYVDAGYTLR